MTDDLISSISKLRTTSRRSLLFARMRRRPRRTGKGRRLSRRLAGTARGAAVRRPIRSGRNCRTTRTGTAGHDVVASRPLRASSSCDAAATERLRRQDRDDAEYRKKTQQLTHERKLSVSNAMEPKNLLGCEGRRRVSDDALRHGDAKLRTPADVQDARRSQRPQCECAS